MYCVNCGKQIQENFQLCPYCGVKIAHNAQPTPPPSHHISPQPNGYNYGNQRPNTNQLPNRNNYYNAQPMKRKNPYSAVATWSLVLGILSMVLSFVIIGFLPAIAAVIVGIIGLCLEAGYGKSLAGIICGIVGGIMCLGFNVVSDDADPAIQPSTEISSEIESETYAEPTEQPSEIQQDEENTEEFSLEEYIDSCEEFNYKKIARDPDDYIGKSFKVTVKIYSTSDGSFLRQSYMKAYTDDGSGYYFDKMIYLFDEQDENSNEYLHILDGDIVTIYGTFEGTVESTNYLNGEKSQEVALHIKYAELIEE